MRRPLQSGQRINVAQKLHLDFLETAPRAFTLTFTRLKLKALALSPRCRDTSDCAKTCADIIESTNVNGGLDAAFLRDGLIDEDNPAQKLRTLDERGVPASK